MKILIVDEAEVVATQLRNRLVASPALTTGSQHIVVQAESNYERAAEFLNDGRRYDVVVVEPYPLEKRFDGAAMEIIRRAAKTRVVPIALTAVWGVERCVTCMRAGAWDVILRARPMHELVSLIVSSILNGLAAHNLTDSDAAWVQQNLELLCRRHPGQWIAVSGGRVLASGDTYDEAIKQFNELPLGFERKLWRLPVEWSNDEPDF